MGYVGYHRGIENVASQEKELEMDNDIPIIHILTKL
uniref:Uncharacterized protein n=1 Tax=Pithovirus LCDPAC01 TaxID=2506600 RepID=A0A481YQG0_9VIRU|nr:MAG: hypothetical protein LCDPAC01_01420 [Pithovirus LCDPAC01]